MSQVQACVEAIQNIAGDFKPQVAMVLGSGLGPFADQVKAIATISFDELPGFPQAGVGGHAGALVLGHVGETCVAVCKGARIIMNKAVQMPWQWRFKPLKPSVVKHWC